MKKVERAYPYNDDDMLTATRILCKNFTLHKSKLICEKPDFDDPFVSDLQASIDNAMAMCFTQTSQRERRMMTQAQRQMQEEILANCSLFKKQLEACFAEDKKQMTGHLSLFGFTEWWDSVEKKDPSGLISLVDQIANNLTTEIKLELIGHGLVGTLLKKMKDYPEMLKEIVFMQRHGNSNAEDLPPEAIDELNSIFLRAANICYTAQRVFPNNSLVKSKFAFVDLVRSIQKSNGFFDLDNGITKIAS